MTEIETGKLALIVGFVVSVVSAILFAICFIAKRSRKHGVVRNCESGSSTQFYSGDCGGGGLCDGGGGGCDSGGGGGGGCD